MDQPPNSGSAPADLLRAVAEAASILNTSASLEQGILQALGLISETLSVDRAYIFANGTNAQGQLTMSQRYEWCRSGVPPQANNPALQNQPYDSFPGLADTLLSHRTHASDIVDLPPAERDFLLAQGVVSILIVPIHVESRWWGFIGFDDCSEHRLWTSLEINILQAIAGIFGGAVSRWDTLAVLRERERHYRYSMEKLQTLFDNLSIGIAVISPDLKVVEVNRQMKVWFPDIDVYDHAICTHMLCDQRLKKPCRTCPILLTFEDGLVHEYIMENNELGPLHSRIISSPLKNEAGQVQAVIEMMEDITERFTLENRIRQSQKMEALGQLAGGIAHDFNNLLTVILNSTDAAREQIPPEAAAHPYIHDIGAAAHRAADLTRRLLTFSRNQPIKTTVIDLNLILTEIQTILRRLIDESIAIRIHPSPHPCWVEADVSQIEQVLINLAVNARDAMPSGGVLDLRLLPLHLHRGRHHQIPELLPPEAHGPHILIQVEDSGTGMTPAQKENLFKPFYTTKPEGKGTGLGLSVVYGIVRKHLGHITCQTHPGKGTRFDIYLPPRPPPPPPPPTAPPPPP
ncbi:MAG TPA: ATP-binding protein, partial [Kiritimatiellia bacterium]|nr:ATP-binding protein [Kiritimatiellia bacterium]